MFSQRGERRRTTSASRAGAGAAPRSAGPRPPGRAPLQQVLAPGLPVGAALEEDLLALRGHHREEAIGVDAAQARRSRPGPSGSGEGKGARISRSDVRGQREDGSTRPRSPQNAAVADAGARPGRTGPGESRWKRRHRASSPSSSAAEAQHDGQEVEEAVVPRAEDAQLQAPTSAPAATSRTRRGPKRRNGATSSMTNITATLARWSTAGSCPDEVRDEVGQRLGPVVELERREAAPRRVPAGELHHAGHEHQPDQEEAHEQDGPEARLGTLSEGRRRPGASGTETTRGLQQQHVPLEAEEDAAQRR